MALNFFCENQARFLSTSTNPACILIPVVCDAGCKRPYRVWPAWVNAGLGSAEPCRQRQDMMKQV